MYQLNPAVLNIDQNLSESKNINKKTTNKTFKNKKNVKFDSSENKPKLTNINNLLHSSNENDSDDDDDDNNFTMQYTSLLNDNNMNNNINNNDLIEAEKRKMNKFNVKSEINSLDKASYSNLSDSYKSTINYLNNNNQPVNSYSIQNDNTIDNNNKLLSKLEYIIHLLEEQHNEKTNHVTEELILYLFLGIFMIYVLDSFTKASKYTR